MIRPGILLYGMSPSKYCDAIDSGFKPAMSLKTNVILVKEVEQNQSISYGRTFTTKRKSIIATIPIGYADGYSRILSNKAKVLINGELLPIVGTICMDTCMVDVTDARDRQNSVANDLEKKKRDVESIFANQVDKSIKPEFNIKVNDEVVLFGMQNDKSISVDEIASIMQTINYEVTCLIGKRIPRAYIQNGKIKEVQNYLLS
jgi:alanine racemase